MSEKLSEVCGFWGVSGLIERPMDIQQKKKQKIIIKPKQPKFVAASECTSTQSHKDIHVFGVYIIYLCVNISVRTHVHSTYVRHKPPIRWCIHNFSVCY